MGIMQHAQGSRPDPDHGYCTDDVARALLVDLLHARELGWSAVDASVARNVRFLRDAFESETGRFRNFRSADGTWLDGAGSQDANARALQALAELIAVCPAGPLRDTATTVLLRALPKASRVDAIRPLATVLLACDTATRVGMSSAVLEVYVRAGDALERAFAGCGSRRRWPWPESIVTYENELPARALIVGGRGLERPGMVETGLHVLDWLIASQMTSAGYLRTVGNDGWWPRGRNKARFDQQPISATSLLLAAEAAYHATGSPFYGEVMEKAYGWFLGRNDAHVRVAKPESGAGYDGIGPAGVSRNQGAESTLMWLTALEHIRALRAASTHRFGGVGQPGSARPDTQVLVSKG